MILFCVILFLLPLVHLSAASPKPNVVFILVDDLGWKDLGCYGSSFYDTPNLDKLAESSVRFTDAYAASPVCSPTRAAIMTGKHPARVNITDWIPGMSSEGRKMTTPEDIHNMPLEELTLAEAMKEGGYRTFYAGKWHLGESPEFWPERQGFDINKGGHSNGSPPGGYYSPYKNPRLADGPEGEYLTDRLTDESIAFLETSSGNPFLLYLAFYTVHMPIQGCDKYDAEYLEKLKTLPDRGDKVSRPERDGLSRLYQDDPKYAAMVRSMDENIGRLLNKLDDLKLSENTMIIFTSDNGGLTTKKTVGPTSVMPLRAGKGWCYEGGIRVPLIVKVPWINTGGTVCHSPVNSMDYYPTILELTGLASRPDQHLDGASIVPMIRDPAGKRDRTLVWHYPHYHGSTWTPGSAIRSGNWKLIEFYEDEKVELYDLSTDLEEQSDLAGTHPDKAKELRKRMHEYLDERNAAYPGQK